MSNMLEVVSVRLVKDAPFYSEKSIGSPQEAVELMAAEFAQYDKEVMCILNLTTKNKPINMNIVSIGILNASLVSPREVFKTSILSNAASIMLLHNHPSGDTTPSKEDILVTKRLATCGQLIGIELLDHIIVGGGNGERYSMAEKGMLSTSNVEQWISELNTTSKKKTGKAR